MSAWNPVLQAVHSAWVDELNARWPNEKLELGLPKRFDGWATPASTESVLARAIACADGNGIVAVGTLRAQEKKETHEIFEAFLTRATREFALRKITARFGDPVEPPYRASMAIWLPIRVPDSMNSPVFDLAVAVY